MQQHDALDGVGIVDDGAVSAVRGAADLTEADLWPCATVAMSLIAMAVPLALLTTVFSMSWTVDRGRALDVDLLRALFDKAAAAVGVVVGDLLLDLGMDRP